MPVKLFYKDKQPIGLDISQTGIKVMAVDPKKWMVEGYGSIDLDPAKMHDALDNEPGEDSYLTDSIKELLSRNIVGNLPSNHAIISIPTERSFSRTFSLPANSKTSLRDAVEIEVNQYIPIPFSSLYVDYEVIEKDKESTTVILSAVPKSLVDACLNATREAGLRPVMVEPSINAVARLLEATEDGHLGTIIVDIGQAYTDIAVYDKSAIRVTGGTAVGGSTFTLDIAKKLNIPLDTAHQYKVLNGLAQSPRQAKITSAMKPNLQRIATEIRKVLRYYDERIENTSKIEQVLIVGAGSNVPGIGDFFTNELIMPARVASPWQRLNFGKLSQPSKQFRSRYITVSGLACIDGKEILR